MSHMTSFWKDRNMANDVIDLVVSRSIFDHSNHRLKSASW
jgi:hypothetical protein